MKIASWILHTMNNKSLPISTSFGCYELGSQLFRSRVGSNLILGFDSQKSTKFWTSGIYQNSRLQWVTQTEKLEPSHRLPVDENHRERWEETNMTTGDLQQKPKRDSWPEACLAFDQLERDEPTKAKIYHLGLIKALENSLKIMKTVMIASSCW